MPSLCFFLLAALLTFPARANWLYLAMSGISVTGPVRESGLQTRSLFRGCDLASLSPLQQRLCLQHPFAMPSVSQGARNAIIECQWQFKYERWNCTNVPAPNVSQTDVFGPTIQQANREAAFIASISSAGVVHSITRACSAGNLTECGCDLSHHRHSTDGERLQDGQWSWGGCSDDIEYGIRFSRRFLDRQNKDKFKDTKDVRYLVYTHNNDVGRETIRSLMKQQCRCHGVSGSCEFKTCWKQMPNFNRVGEVIKSRYDLFSVQVARRAKKRLRRKERSERRIQIRPNELVFVNRSPNYCEKNEDMGILGTQGRECNKTSFGSASCDLLCCGRGYDTKEVTRSGPCHCKFVWCCYVKCKTCRDVLDIHTCK